MLKLSEGNGRLGYLAQGLDAEFEGEKYEVGISYGRGGVG